MTLAADNPGHTGCGHRGWVVTWRTVWRQDLLRTWQLSLAPLFMGRSWKLDFVHGPRLVRIEDIWILFRKGIRGKEKRRNQRSGGKTWGKDRGGQRLKGGKGWRREGKREHS